MQQSGSRKAHHTTIETAVVLSYVFYCCWHCFVFLSRNNARVLEGWAYRHFLHAERAICQVRQSAGELAELDALRAAVVHSGGRQAEEEEEETHPSSSSSHLEIALEVEISRVQGAAQVTPPPFHSCGRVPASKFTQKIRKSLVCTRPLSCGSDRSPAHIYALCDMRMRTSLVKLCACANVTILINITYKTKLLLLN